MPIGKRQYLEIISWFFFGNKTFKKDYGQAYRESGMKF